MWGFCDFPKVVPGEDFIFGDRAAGETFEFLQGQVAGLQVFGEGSVSTGEDGFHERLARASCREGNAGEFSQFLSEAADRTLQIIEGSAAESLVGGSGLGNEGRDVDFEADDGGKLSDSRNDLLDVRGLLLGESNEEVKLKRLDVGRGGNPRALQQFHVRKGLAKASPEFF